MSQADPPQRHFATQGDLDAVLNSITDALACVDAQWNFTYVNSEVERILEIPAEALLGKKLWEAVPAIVRDTGVESDLRSVMQTRAVREWEVRSGRGRWYRCRAFPTDTGGLSVLFANITERKEAEYALVRSNAFHQVISELSADYAWTAVVDDESRIQIEEVTAGFTRMLGYTLDEFLARGGWLTLVHPDDVDEVRAMTRRVLAGETVQGELRQIAKDGQVHWVQYRTRPVKNSAGRVVRLYGGGWETTPKRVAEEALRRSEAQLRLVTDAIPALITYIDRDYRYRFVNRAISEWFGLAPEEVHGKTVEEIVGKDAFEVIQPSMDRAFSGQAVRFEADVPYRLGGTRSVEATYVPDVREDGAVEGYVALIQDISKRKRAEHERERLNAVVENSKDFIAYATTEGRILYMNKAGRDLVGLDSVSDSEWTCLRDLLPRHWHPRFDQIILPIAMTGGHWEGEIQFRHFKTGATIDLVQTLFVVPDPQTGQPGLATVAHDITERKRSEKALQKSERHLRQLSKSLEDRVAERTAELEQQTERLRRLSTELTSAEQRERKRLAALLHDDLQQILVATKFQLSNAARTAGNRVTEKAIEDAATRLEDAILSARNLTRELRPPSLYEAGLLPALKWLSSQMWERYRLNASIEADGVSNALSDDTNGLLFECVRELLFNAAKHAGAGQATVAVSQTGESLRVVVSDRGDGFDVSALVDLGSENFGLFSIRERIKALGGYVTIESSPGEGTRVELDVPVPSAAQLDGGAPLKLRTPAPVDANSRAYLTTDPRTRVMVADDHAIVRNGIAEILRGDERIAVVGEAADGADAIRAVESTHPHVVLMDVNMPTMNGIDATREIRRRWPGVVIVGLSVQDDASTARAMLEAGACAFVPKSGDPAELITVVLREAGVADPA